MALSFLPLLLECFLDLFLNAAMFAVLNDKVELCLARVVNDLVQPAYVRMVLQAQTHDITNRV